MEFFKPGDLAVYPAHGVGLIETVEPRCIDGTDQEFYIMRILDNNLTIFIPTANAENIGLRSVIDREDVERIMSILGEKTAPSTGQTWNRRYRGYMDKIKTGSVFEVAEVYRDLNLIKSHRELSFGERKVLDVAQNLLIKELSVVEEADEAEVVERIESIFG